MNQDFSIGNFSFSSPGTFIIAELSANHNGSLEMAIATIREAKKVGADAIKLQTYTPDTITLNVRRPDFQVKQGTLWDGKYLYDLYQEAYTPWEWHETLFEVAREQGLICFSSPFDASAVRLLEGLDVPAYKIASFEITDIPLIKMVATQGKPVLISTGVADLEDIQLAIHTCLEAGNDKIILLKCTSSYPSPVSEANLAMIKDYRERFGVISGLSDHSLGITVPILSVAMGARVIEKHFIIDRSIGGPDASFSLNSQEFSAMVQAVREAEQAIGEVDYALSPKSLKNKEFSRSLYVAQAIMKGEEFTIQNVRSVRPGFGLHPKFLNQIIGKTASRNLMMGEALEWEMVASLEGWKENQ